MIRFMNKKIITNIFGLLLTAFTILVFLASVQAQVKDEKPTTCEYLKLQLDVLTVKSAGNPNKSGLRSYVVFVVSPGNKKASNIRIARKLIKALDSLLKTESYKSLRYAIVEGKQRKGFGQLQIYFVDELTDLVFDENIFFCP